MKRSLLVALITTLAASVLCAADETKYTPESRTVTETFTTKVVKVYRAHDGDAIYSAYVVIWKDQEVVVAPPPFSPESKEYEVGDVVRCQMQQGFFRRTDGPSTTRMTFSLAASAVAEQARLESVAAEVARRRQLRNAQLRQPRDGEADVPDGTNPSDKASSAPAPASK